MTQKLLKIEIVSLSNHFADKAVASASRNNKEMWYNGRIKEQFNRFSKVQVDFASK